MNSSPTYGKRLRDAANKEFSGFWSSYRNWATFATVFLVPVGIQIVRHGWRSVANLDETLANGFIGLIMSLAGTYFIAVWKGAEALDAGLRADVTARDRAIEERNTQIRQHEQTIQAITEKPKRSPVEEHHYEATKAALARLGPDAATVLRHLSTHETLTFGNYPPANLPAGFSGEATRKVLQACVGEDLVTVQQTYKKVFYEYVYAIAPRRKAALNELLYPPP